MGSRLLGELISQLSTVTTTMTAENETPLAIISKQLLFHLSGKSAVQKMAATMVTMEWASAKQVRQRDLSQSMPSRLLVQRRTECLFEKGRSK